MDENEIIRDDKLNSILHKDDSLKRLDKSFLIHIEKEEYKKSNLLAYWIKDFSDYHDNENSFDFSTLKAFKRGDIIKANLGFNVGHEFGGLHYCVVINKKDNQKCGTLNVIPLTSIKEDKIYNTYFNVNLEDEVYSLLINKYNKIYMEASKALNEMQMPIMPTKENFEKLKPISDKFSYLRKMEEEISKMKQGSIALVHQITTISKQRIFKNNILSGIRISDSSLNKIDNTLKRVFTK